MPLLETVSISKSWGTRHAVRDFSLALEPGRIHGLLGANGAGKTTALVIMAGLVPPDRGQVLLAGEDLHTGPASLRRRIGWLPEIPALYPEMTVERQLQFFGRLFGLTQDACAARAEELLSIFRLQDRRRDRAAALSAGLKRRVSLVISLIHDPEVLLLDEPTANLDVATRERLQLLLAELAQQGKAIVVASHRLEEIEQICDAVTVLEEGRTVDRRGSQTDSRADGRRLVRLESGRHPGLPADTPQTANCKQGSR